LDNSAVGAHHAEPVVTDGLRGQASREFAYWTNQQVPDMTEYDKSWFNHAISILVECGYSLESARMAIKKFSAQRIAYTHRLFPGKLICYNCNRPADVGKQFKYDHGIVPVCGECFQNPQRYGNPESVNPQLNPDQAEMDEAREAMGHPDKPELEPMCDAPVRDGARFTVRLAVDALGMKAGTMVDVIVGFGWRIETPTLWVTQDRDQGAIEDIVQPEWCDGWREYIPPREPSEPEDVVTDR
jgi:hypothetical protein